MITCRFEKGFEKNLRHVTVDAICIKDGKILLERRGNDIIGGGKLAVPGGYLDRDETTAQGILREIREETGYEGRIVKLLKFIDQPERGDDRQNVTFLYLVEIGEKVGDGDGEAAEVFWCEPDNLPLAEDFAFDHYSFLQHYLADCQKNG